MRVRKSFNDKLKEDENRRLREYLDAAEKPDPEDPDTREWTEEDYLLASDNANKKWESERRGENV